MTVLNGDPYYAQFVGSDGTTTEYYVSGGTASDEGSSNVVVGTIIDAGYQEIDPGGFAIDTIDYFSGNQTVYGGITTGTILSGGYQEIDQAGTAVGTIVYGGGGDQTVASELASNTTLSGGIQLVDGGGGLSM